MEKISIASDSPHFTQEHMLFGHSYLLEFEWIEREEMWLLHIYDGAQNPIALGMKVAEGWPIFTDQKSGVVFWLMAKNPNVSLGFNSLHKDFTLMAENAGALV